MKVVCKIINLSLPNLACFARSTLLRVVSLSNHALARVNPRIGVFQVTGNFAQAAQTLNYSNTRFFPDCAGKKEVRLVGEQPTNSTDDHGIASVMPAWTAGIQVRRDGSGHIHVNLGSGTPCRNDEMRNIRQS